MYYPFAISFTCFLQYCISSEKKGKKPKFSNCWTLSPLFVLLKEKPELKLSRWSTSSSEKIAIVQ